jgi:hypothetical protein
MGCSVTFSLVRRLLATPATLEGCKLAMLLPNRAKYDHRTVIMTFDHVVYQRGVANSREATGLARRSHRRQRPTARPPRRHLGSHPGVPSGRGGQCHTTASSSTGSRSGLRSSGTGNADQQTQSILLRGVFRRRLVSTWPTGQAGGRDLLRLVLARISFPGAPDVGRLSYCALPPGGHLLSRAPMT